jgi:hypothetical protein
MTRKILEISEPKDYTLKPKDYKVPTGYQVNTDKEYQEMLIKYPTFESIKVGAITMSSDYKKSMMRELETRKTSLWFYWQAQKALSYINTMIDLYNEPGYNYKELSPGAYLVAKDKIELDMKGYKEDIAKADVFFNLIKLKMMESK